MSPIERMIDQLEWTRAEEPDEIGDLPYVTHRGTLKIDTLELEVVQLNTGQRVIPESSLARFFAWLGVDRGTLDYEEAAS